MSKIILFSLFISITLASHSAFSMDDQDSFEEGFTQCLTVNHSAFSMDDQDPFEEGVKQCLTVNHIKHILSSGSNQFETSKTKKRVFEIIFYGKSSEYLDLIDDDDTLLFGNWVTREKLWLFEHPFLPQSSYYDIQENEEEITIFKILFAIQEVKEEKENTPPVKQEVPQKTPATSQRFVEGNEQILTKEVVESIRDCGHFFKEGARNFELICPDRSIYYLDKLAARTRITGIWSVFEKGWLFRYTFPPDMKEIYEVGKNEAMKHLLGIVFIIKEKKFWDK